jgi:hypothetical protein
MSAAPSGQPSFDSQLQFARHNFDNHQNLIRLADAKAAAYITLLIFLGASTFPFAKDVVPKLSWSWCHGGLSSGIYAASYAAFLIAFLIVIFLAHRVIAPRGARHYRSAEPGIDLMYFEHVLLHSNQETYLDAVQSASPELLLRNVVDQVFELAHICRDKMAALTRARRPLFVAFCSWLVNIGTCLYILRWK